MKTIKLLTTLVLLALFTISINSCKKYDEGGRLGAANRKIVNAWKVVHAIDLENGSNITADFNG